MHIYDIYYHSNSWNKCTFPWFNATNKSTFGNSCLIYLELCSKGLVCCCFSFLGRLLCEDNLDMIHVNNSSFARDMFSMYQFFVLS